VTATGSRLLGSMVCAFGLLCISCKVTGTVGESCADCGAGQRCLPALAVCVTCIENADCAPQAAAPHCDQTSHECVQCLSDADCSPIARCVAGQCGACRQDASVCIGDMCADEIDCNDMQDHIGP
jgi:hypothetical protein